jgi:hypothetical protein
LGWDLDSGSDALGLWMPAFTRMKCWVGQTSGLLGCQLSILDINENEYKSNETMIKPSRSLIAIALHESQQKSCTFSTFCQNTNVIHNTQNPDRLSDMLKPDTYRNEIEAFSGRVFNKPSILPLSFPALTH